MKKNGYLRKFIAMFLVFVMLMADSSMTTFAETVGSVRQQNADQGVAVQDVSNEVNVIVNAPDGTYYLGIMKDGNMSKIAQVAVSGGSATTTVKPAWADQNISNGQVVMLTLKSGKSYTEKYDQNDYNILKSGTYLNYSNGSYKIETSQITNKTASLSINSVGNNTTSQQNILNTLGMAANFMIVSNKFVQNDHYEGNIAVNEFVPSGSPIGVNGTETQLDLKITVSKTVTPAKSASFEFGIYDAENTLVTTLTVTTGTDGQGSSSYTINDAKNSYKVYELDAQGKPLADGDKNGEYTVSYSSSEGLDNEIPNYGKSSFAKIVTGKKDLTANKNSVLYTTTDNVTMQNGVVKKVTDTEFVSMVDIEDMLSNVKTLSNQLKNMKTSGDVVVYNLDANNLPIENGGHLNLPGIGSDQALVLNVIIPTGTTEYHLGSGLNSFNVGNESLKISGYQTAAEAALANRTIWNFVYEDGTPYTGTVYQETTLGGTYLVPDGTIYGANSTPVALYAKSVNQYSGYSELHQGGFRTTRISRDANVAVSNSTEPDKVTINGTKTWNDADNQDGKRPTSITVRLLADGKEVANKVVTGADDWKYSFKDFPKYQEGTKTEIVYTIQEDKVDGYTTDITGNVTDGFNITNSYTPEKISINGIKTWDDNDNQDGKRPDKITVRLLANGKEVDHKEVAEADGWKYSFDNLDKYANGKEITYTVTEDAVTDYTTVVSGYDITNSYTPGKTSVSVMKYWEDNNNQDGLRAKEIKVQLYADGAESGEPVALNSGNNWTYTWNNLAQKKSGKDIAYTVEEVGTVTGYTTTVTGDAATGFTITNTHEPETIEVSGSKTWDDADNQDGKRPNKITVRLLANGKEVDHKEVAEADGWKYSFTGLPKYEAGKEIVYTVTEDTVKDYTTAISGYNIRNSYTPGKTSVSVTKAWDDNNNQDGLRAKEIKVQLYADGVASGEPVALNSGNSWTYTWNNLAQKKSGKDIAYTVEEVGTVTGYTTTVTGDAATGFKITNTHNPEKISINGIKTWNDSNDQDGKRPESITVRLFADGTEAASQVVTVDKDGNWKYSFDNLDKYANGKEITYTVTEDTVADYTTVVRGYDITNSYTPGKTSVSVTKAWDDNNNQDGLRAKEIKVQLYADGVASGEPVALNSGNSWSYTWKDLAKKANKKDIAYTVEEVGTVTGYTATVTGDAATGFKITNTHNPEKISISGTKTWSDNDNQDGLRPTSITVNLLADGTKVDSKEVTADDNWKYEFINLPKYADGNEISYTVEEVAVDGYETTVNGYDITNTHKPETTKVEGTKTWNDNNNQDGKRPTSITVNLLANGTKIDSTEVTADDNWKYSFDNLAKYENGNEIIYTVSEEPVDGYVASVNDYDITNTHETEKTEVSGIKSWDDAENQDGIRPDKITVNLLADGSKVDSKEVTADDNWAYSFTDLPKYAAGKEIVYTVTEDKVDGYETAVNGFNILNTHTPETTKVSGSKTWNDNNNQDGIRPTSITVNLLANGNTYASQVVTAAGNWTYNFTDLPKYEAGTEIIYTVEETAVEGYTTEIDGYDIINTHTPETTEVSGTKTWSDSDDQDGKRPSKITVNLLANGTKVDSQEVTADNNWTYSFTDLPVYRDGQQLTYTVSEETVADYTTTYDGFNITNSYTPGKTSATVVKVWNDAENQDGKRPESITVSLLADGKATGTTVTLSADNNWSETVTDLDEKANGKAIVYTWAEENVPEGYELTGNTADGTVTTLTNTYTTETTSISGSKTWNDSNDQDGKRPESITVNLLANDKVIASQTVTAATNWSYVFENLPVYANGQKITYTVTEDAVAGYTTEINGYDITNTHTTETTSVEGQKVWNDANNQDGKRPESITVRLLANGTEVQNQTVTADTNWAYSFTELPKYANGEEIVYTVTEDAVADYTTAINGTTITNSYTPGKTSVTVTKAWVDNDDQDGIRPESIKVQLYAGNEAQGEEVTLDAANKWTYTWTDLDEKKDGQDITYTVKEVGEVTGYTSEISGDAEAGFVITNTHTTETTSVEGKKVWDDAENQDGKRPESITIRLLANGAEVASKEVTEADNWSYSFTDLPKYEAGKEIVYTVTEDAVADYTTAIDGTTITNSYTPGKTSVTVTKAWVDNDDQDGIRPDEIKVQLYAGNEAQGEEVTLNEENKWTYIWTDLDEKKDGQDIVYTVRETEVPAGYEASVTGTATEGFILTNTHQTEVISVEGTKTWNDNDQTTKRPESITVRLLADGKEVNSQTVTADSNWTYKFTELPKYAAGKEIVYTVSEDAVSGYLTSVNGNNLINTITSVKVSKVDITDQKELSGAHIQVIDKDGNIVDEWDSTWEAHEVTGLKTNEKYTLRETVAPDGYTVTSDTTFTLKEDGTVDKDNTDTTISDDGRLLVEDTMTSVKVSKVDIADGTELEGAHIQILDEDENIVAEWDSTKEAHEIKGLKTGKKYTLRETAAPTGYELTNDTTFVLKADGTVDTENTTTVSKDGILLVQDKLATGQTISVTKRLTTITGDLRAMDQTFYVALYSDEACTQRVSDVKAIEFKNASSSTVTFDKDIEVNKTYYIAECSEDGTAQSMGALADGTMYEAKFNEGNTATVTEANGTTTVYFENVFSSLPDGFYKQGKLTITKKLLGADGNAKKSNNVFYAGIFDDADYTQLSTQVSQNIVKLDLAGGSEVSQTINIGLDENKAVTLYVTETDSNGKPIAGTSGFTYEVSVDGSTVTIDEANENASVTITNKENPTTTKTTTEESEESGSSSSASSHSMSSSTKAPKTGDDTPIAMYLMILLIAAAVISAFGFGKLRRKNKK